MKADLFFLYLGVMAGVTYLVRMLPLVLCRKKIQSRFIRSFLSYVPYAVLSAMTLPGIFYSTGSIESAAAGCAAAVLLAFFDKSLLTVAVGASAAALIGELVMKFIV